MDLTHPPSRIELPTISAVDDGFLSPKTKIYESDIESPPLKFEKPKPTNPSVFSTRCCRSGELWDVFEKI